MGKYMKKGVMEIPQSTTLGVRTRARTLALQPNPELSYLQLRNRRLEKPPFQPKPQLPNSSKQGLSKVVGPSNLKVRVDSDEFGKEEVEGRFGHFHESEASFDENQNHLEFDERERSTRESTPCSFIRDTEPIGTPGSSTTPTCSSSASRRARNAQMGAIPTTLEMEEFFAGFELDQQKLFMEKYNYDVMNDSPLPGRYEWVRVDN